MENPIGSAVSVIFRYRQTNRQRDKQTNRHPVTLLFEIMEQYYPQLIFVPVNKNSKFYFKGVEINIKGKWRPVEMFETY